MSLEETIIDPCSLSLSLFPSSTRLSPEDNPERRRVLSRKKGGLEMPEDSPYFAAVSREMRSHKTGKRRFAETRVRCIARLSRLSIQRYTHAVASIKIFN